MMFCLVSFFDFCFCVCFSQEVAPKFTGLLSSKYKEVRIEDLAKAIVINIEHNRKKAGDETLEFDDFQRIWTLEKFSYDIGRNEALGADH